MANAVRKVKPRMIKKTAVKPSVKGGAAKEKAGVPAYTAKTAIEITATFPDSVGLTAKVAEVLAAQNVNILAGTGISASGMTRKATFNFIVDDYAKAEKALDEIGAADIEESSVIVVEMANKVGALKRISKIIADAGINIYYFYATTSSGKTATCVLKTADDARTIKLLHKK